MIAKAIVGGSPIDANEAPFHFLPLRDVTDSCKSGTAEL